MISLGDNSENETEADTITNATKNIQYYIDNIADADYLETDTLNGILISALLSINYSLDCLYGKLNIIATVFQDCLAGNGDMESIYADAKELEKKKVEDECITNGYFTYEDIVNVTAEAMILYNASTICIRNNPLKLLLVCGDWYDDVDNTTIASTHNITEDDVNYFIALCEPADITDNIAESICSKKADDETGDEVSATYFKFNTTQILAAYDECNLTTSQQENVCNMKNDGYSYVNLITKYSLYRADHVGGIYNNCALAVEITPADGTTMCNYQTYGFAFDGPFASLWEPLIAKYGMDTVEAYLANNCTDAAGDTVSKKDHKTSFDYHENHREPTFTNSAGDTMSKKDQKTSSVEIIPADGRVTCIYQAYGFGFDGPLAPLWGPLIDKYGMEAIKAYLANNCTDAAGDTMSKKDHKTSFDYHENHREPALNKLQDSNR